MGLDLDEWADLNLGAVHPADLVRVIEACDPATVTIDENLGIVAACEQVIRFLSARQTRAIAAAANHVPPEAVRHRWQVTGAEETAAELTTMLALPPRTAADRVAAAQMLVRDSGKLLNAVETGRLDLYRAQRLDDQLREFLEPGSEDWDSMQDTLAEKAPGRTTGQLDYFTRRAQHLLDPRAAARRHQKAKNDRQVIAYPENDGMGTLSARLSADKVQTYDGLLDALADACRDHAHREGDPDPRTHQQRRADAFSAIFDAINYGTALPIIPTPEPTPHDPADPANDPIDDPADGPTDHVSAPANTPADPANTPADPANTPADPAGPDPAAPTPEPADPATADPATVDPAAPTHPDQPGPGDHEHPTAAAEPDHHDHDGGDDHKDRGRHEGDDESAHQRHDEPRAEQDDPAADDVPYTDRAAESDTYRGAESDDNRDDDSDDERDDDSDDNRDDDSDDERDERPSAAGTEPAGHDTDQEPGQAPTAKDKQAEERQHRADLARFGGTLLPANPHPSNSGRTSSSAGSVDSAGSTGQGQSPHAAPHEAATDHGVLAWWMPPDLPTEQGRRPHLIVTIAQSTLDGDDDLPADLKGYGPIPATLARDIAAQAGSQSTIVLPEGPHPSQAPPLDNTTPAAPRAPSDPAPAEPGAADPEPSQAAPDPTTRTRAPRILTTRLRTTHPRTAQAPVARIPAVPDLHRPGPQPRRPHPNHHPAALRPRTRPPARARRPRPRPMPMPMRMRMRMPMGRSPRRHRTLDRMSVSPPIRCAAHRVTRTRGPTGRTRTRTRSQARASGVPSRGLVPGTERSGPWPGMGPASTTTAPTTTGRTRPPSP